MFKNFFSKKEKSDNLINNYTQNKTSEKKMNKDEPFLTEKSGFNKDKELVCIKYIISSVLLKNHEVIDDDIIWNLDREKSLNYALEELGYNERLEQLILDEWLISKTNYKDVTKSIFVTHFLNMFHNVKLSKYNPTFIKERNDKIEKAYFSIIDTIKRIQTWIDNEKTRTRVEVHLTDDKENYNYVHKCFTPFCLIYLCCDTLGRLRIAYAIDSRIVETLPSGMASTLVRRIYEFTSNELESFVDMMPINWDCLKLFEKSIETANNDENYKVITVKMDKEDSLSTLSDKKELRENINGESEFSRANVVKDSEVRFEHYPLDNKPKSEIIVGKNSFLYPEDGLGKMESGTVSNNKIKNL